MLDDETIAHQQAMLDTYRRNLRQLLRQVAQYGGEAHAPLVLINSLHETRNHLQQIKVGLRAYGIVVSDSPDEEHPIDAPGDSATPIRTQQITERRVYGCLGISLYSVTISRTVMSLSLSIITLVAYLTTLPPRGAANPSPPPWVPSANEILGTFIALVVYFGTFLPMGAANPAPPPGIPSANKIIHTFLFEPLLWIEAVVWVLLMGQLLVLAARRLLDRPARHNPRPAASRRERLAMVVSAVGQIALPLILGAALQHSAWDVLASNGSFVILGSMVVILAIRELLRNL